MKEHIASECPFCAVQQCSREMHRFCLPAQHVFQELMCRYDFCASLAGMLSAFAAGFHGAR